MQMYFRFYLDDCGPDEIRCVWFGQKDVHSGMITTVELRQGGVDTAREVNDATAYIPHFLGHLDPAQIAALRSFFSPPPPSQDVFPMGESVFVAHREGGTVQVAQYNRVVPPPLVRRLFDLAKSDIALGEPDVGSAISLRVDELDRLTSHPRPWTVPRMLDWYAQAATPTDRQFWAHILTVSGDPRAALALEKNLGQGDNSASLREMASDFFGHSYDKDKQTLADARQWFKDNHPRLEAQAAILNGKTPPALPATPPCPDVTFHEIPGPHANYDEATVTLDRSGLAHIAIKQKSPLGRDFVLGSELAAHLSQLVTDGKFFTAAEPPAPTASATGSTELTIAFDGQKRTVHQVWAPDFAPLRDYFSELIFLTLLDAGANPTPATPSARKPL